MSYEELMGKLSPKLKKAVQTLDQKEEVFYQSASVGLNLAANNAFAAGGRMTLLHGSSGSGKSLLLLQSIAEWQKQGLTCLYLDSEGTVTDEFAARLGVNTGELIYIRKRGMGQAVDSMMPYIEAGVDIAVVDTYSDLIPDQFQNEDGTIKDFDDTKQIGAQAKSTKRMLDSLMYSMHDHTALVMMSQQTMAKAGTMFIPAPYGGEKPKFEASTMIKLSSSRASGQQLKSEVEINGEKEKVSTHREVNALVEKSKFGPEFKTARWNIYYDGPNLGIDFPGETVELGKRYGILSASGAWVYYDDHKWNGGPAAAEALRNDPDLKAEIDKKIGEAVALG